MAFSFPVESKIEIPEADLGNTMGRIRSWFDANKIEPIEFKTVSQGNGAVTFMIRFRTEDEAGLFVRAFSMTLPN